MTVLILSLILACSGLISAWLMPRPKIRPPIRPAPEPFTYHVEEPEHEFDPLAFWLFPDWDSGPPKEPFWMRPLKQPSPSYRIERNYDNRESFGAMMHGRHRVPGQMIAHNLVERNRESIRRALDTDRKPI